MVKPRQADIARAVGASLSTVSKALNSRSDVSPELRDRILRAAAEVGYEAPRVRAGGAATIHMLTEDLRNPYAPVVLSGVVDRATELGYDLTIHINAAHRATPNGPLPGSSGWINQVADGGAAGLIVLTLPTSRVDVQTAARRSFPVALIDPIDETPPEVLSVSATNWQGGRQATQHLIDLGHRRIGVAGGLATSRPAMERIEGYRSALEGAGIAFDPDLILQENFHYEAGLAGARYLLGLKDPPTAIFALSDLVALGVVDSCRRRGVRIPEDVSLIGFDDTPLARSYVPALTTIRQPLEAMGSAAVTLLDNARRQPGADWARFQLETRLVVRDSTGPAAQ